MSRSGYSDDVEDQWALICWRGAVASSIRGKRGQTFLREALAALDALPEAALVGGHLEAAGNYCLLGAVGKARGTALHSVDVDDHEAVATLFQVPHALACEIMWENDEGGQYLETPRARWERMRTWVARRLNGDLPAGGVKPLPAADDGLSDSHEQAVDHAQRSAP